MGTKALTGRDLGFPGYALGAETVDQMKVFRAAVTFQPSVKTNVSKAIKDLVEEINALSPELYAVINGKTDEHIGFTQEFITDNPVPSGTINRIASMILREVEELLPEEKLHFSDVFYPRS